MPVMTYTDSELAFMRAIATDGRGHFIRENLSMLVDLAEKRCVSARTIKCEVVMRLLAKGKKAIA